MLRNPVVVVPTVDRTAASLAGVNPTPNLVNPYRLRVWLSVAAQMTIATGVTTKLHFDQITRDPSHMWQAATWQAKIPPDGGGTYRVGGRCSFAIGARVIVTCLVNAAEVSRGVDCTGVGQTGSVLADEIDLLPGDLVELDVFQALGAPANTDVGSNFVFFFLGGMTPL